MKVIISSILLLALLSVTACSSTKETTKNTASTSKASDNKDSLVFASLERGYCFGECKVYTVKFYVSGRAEYLGKANVDKIGDFIGQISKDQMEQISAVAKEIEFAKMDDTYDDPRLQDVPGHTSAVRINDELKTVKRRVNYPQSIKELEDKIDEIIAQIDWKSVNK